MISNLTSRSPDQLRQNESRKSRKTYRSLALRRLKKSRFFPLRHVDQGSPKSNSSLPPAPQSIFHPEFRTQRFAKPRGPHAVRQVLARAIKRRPKRKGNQPKNESGGIRH